MEMKFYKFPKENKTSFSQIFVPKPVAEKDILLGIFNFQFLDFNKIDYK